MSLPKTSTRTVKGFCIGIWDFILEPMLSSSHFTCVALIIFTFAHETFCLGLSQPCPSPFTGEQSEGTVYMYLCGCHSRLPWLSTVLSSSSALHWLFRHLSHSHLLLMGFKVVQDGFQMGYTYKMDFQRGFKVVLLFWAPTNATFYMHCMEIINLLTRWKCHPESTCIKSLILFKGHCYLYLHRSLQSFLNV